MVDWLIGGFLVLLLTVMVIKGVRLEIEHRRMVRLLSNLERLGKQIRMHTFLIQEANTKLRDGNYNGMREDVGRLAKFPLDIGRKI